MLQKKSYQAFTILEMLIVIVIIGIVSIALIPRLIGIQARARDTARISDMRNASIAIESYKIDHGSYPGAVYAFNNSQEKKPLFIPRVFAQTPGSSLESISSLVGEYLTLLPNDPSSMGIQAANDTSCLDQGKSYGYYTDPEASLYAITARKESKRGNASSCGDAIDRAGDGDYEKIGKGLTALISANTEPGATTGPATDPNCFTITTAGAISDYPNSSCPRDVVIPSTISGIVMTSIGNSAFSNKGLTSVVIPISITNIDGQAFRNNQLTSVTIPDSVTTIGGSAFYGNQLTSVTIPDSITIINPMVFRNNNLTSLTIPDSVTTIHGSAFRENQLTSVTIPNSITSIGASAFEDNQLTSITIPDSVTGIGINAFAFNQLTSVTIPNSVATMQNNAFRFGSKSGVHQGIIGDFIPSTHQTRNVSGTTWVKQPPIL